MSFCSVPKISVLFTGKKDTIQNLPAIVTFRLTVSRTRALFLEAQ